MDRKQYSLAIEFFQDEYEQADSKDLRARKAFLLGECYSKINETTDAGKWYDEAVRLDFGTEALWALAANLKMQEQYQKAIALYRIAQQEGWQLSEVQREIKVCQQAMLWQQESDDVYSISPLDINTPYDEYSPMFYQGGFLVFTSDRVVDPSSAKYNWTGNDFSDLYIVRQGGGEALLFDSYLNTVHNEGTAVFTKNFDQIFFTRCQSNDGDDFCKIYWSKNDNGRWLDAITPFAMDPKYNYMHPTLIENDSVLIFSSNLPGGEGGYDLYYSFLDEDGWTLPDLMPSRLNSMGNESFPTSDGDTLYYSSDYLPGLGGLDIFKATVDEEGNWSNPENLRLPINSGADDFGFIMDRSNALKQNEEYSAYMTSTRLENSGDDIFLVTKYVPTEDPNEPDLIADSDEDSENKIRIYLAGRVVEKEYEYLQDPNSRIIGKLPITNARVGIEGPSLDNEIKTDNNGRFYVDLIDNSKYILRASSEGYFNKKIDLELNDISLKTNTDTTINVEILLDKIFEGEEIVLNNIYYDYNESFIREDAKPSLDSLSLMLKENPELKIQLASHTDCRGEEDLNLALSDRRANAAVSYIISTGIDPSRLVAKGYGKTRMAIDCNCDDCSEEQHQVNRRTTFKIL